MSKVLSQQLSLNSHFPTTVNEHEWTLDDGKNTGKCSHDCLNEEERQKPLLKENSKAHNALQKLCLARNS